MNLVLVTVDCLRADHTGFMGYGRPTTPFLDVLASESVVFDNAFVGGVPTYFSFPAIMASRHPLAFGRGRLGLAPGEPTLAASLRKSGFETGAFVAGNPYITKRFRYDQGFDHFQDFLTAAAEVPQTADSPNRLNAALQKLCGAWGLSDRLYSAAYARYCRWAVSRRGGASMDALRRYPAADRVVDAALEWLDRRGSGPFFLWLHFMDPHHPYYPPEEALRAVGDSAMTAKRALKANMGWSREQASARKAAKQRREIVALYDAGIRWADEQVKRLAAYLDETGRWSETVCALTSDHGESFLENGQRYHYPTSLERHLTHVPLLLRFPGLENGRRVPSLFSLLDLAPTLLESLSIDAPPDFRGKPRWKELFRGEGWEGVTITECVKDCRNPMPLENRLGPRLLSVRQGRRELMLDFQSGAADLRDRGSAEEPGSSEPESERRRVKAGLLRRAEEHLTASQDGARSERGMAFLLADLAAELAAGHRVSKVEPTLRRAGAGDRS